MFCARRFLSARANFSSALRRIFSVLGRNSAVESMRNLFAELTDRKPLRSAGIVADGPMRLWRSQWFKERRAEIESKLRERYAEKLNSKDWWKQTSAESKLQREIQHELGK